LKEENKMQDYQKAKQGKPSRERKDQRENKRKF